MGNKGNRTTETSTNPRPIKDALTFLAETIFIELLTEAVCFLRDRGAIPVGSRNLVYSVTPSSLVWLKKLWIAWNTDLIQLILPIAKFNHYIGCGVHWTKEGVKMENQNEPLLIRPSRTPKTNPKKNFCSKSLPTMGASTWFLCVTFYVCLQNLCKKSLTCHKN